MQITLSSVFHYVRLTALVLYGMGLSFGHLTYFMFPKSDLMLLKNVHALCTF